jgi:AhpD family alkylhydroperoxidase
VLVPSLVWARDPWLLVGITLLWIVLDRKRSPLDPVLRALVTVRVSQLNSCKFCVDVHSAALLERGAPREKLEALPNWTDSALFSPEERAALEYGEAMTRTEPRVHDDLFDRVQRCFSEDALVELTALVAFQNLSSRFNSALAIPAQGFCKIPEPADETEARR